MELAFCLLFLLLAVSIALGIWERNEWSKERRELTQRIQVPEQAVASYGRTEPPKPVAPIALDDDEAFEKLRLERAGLSGDS